MLDYLTAALASFASVEVLLALAVGVVGGMIIGLSLIHISEPTRPY